MLYRIKKVEIKFEDEFVQNLNVTSSALIRFARASYCDIGKLSYTTYMNLISQSHQALQPELNYFEIKL